VATGHFNAAGPLAPAKQAAVAQLLDDASTYLRVLGRPADARPVVERALAIDEAAYGPDHPNVANDLNNLALVLQDLGEPQQARPLAERALAISERTLGPDHHYTLGPAKPWLA
jgi:tetratricopeptide (TPR) repeat protein